LPKKVSEIQKQKISESFINGLEIKEISEIYKFSKQTIIKQLKNTLGDKEFNSINKKRAINSELEKTKSIKIKNDEKLLSQKNISKDDINTNLEKEMIENTFFEIPPIVTEIDLENQRDITSKSLTEANLPKLVYMIVDKNIELEPKLLKEFPEWSFLSENDLNRKTIQIFSDQKLAKQTCSKNQKLIKITNTNVFLIASKNLKLKGISRIIFEDSLLAL